ncbi:unnamed protein product [Somion occarium]|uniref:Protein kinase domain-containing protein n=1 Tax=Somion occarium TaxID=3059160 RepID=A0ABP1DTQ3_9APHY
MAVAFIGPTPPRIFLDNLLVPSDPMWTFKSMPVVDFSTVLSGRTCGNDSEVYQPLSDAVNNSGICAGFKLILATNTEDPQARLRPDLVLVKSHADDVNSFSDKDIDPDSEEKTEERSEDSRIRQISYVVATMSRQHRVFIFSLAICGRYIRFLRWDCVGCIVSECIDYQKNPELVAEFFWRYSHMTDRERGFDVTVRRADQEQADLLTAAIEAFIKQSRPRDMSYLRASMDPTYATCSVCMDDEEGDARHFIIRQPFWDANLACGRATRAYAAYDTTEKKLVFLKDSWRAENNDIMCEVDIYNHLQDNKVPFLPKILLADDVKVDGSEQRTFSDQWSTPDIFPEWRSPCDWLWAHIHCRIVQELAYPVASAQSSREAVQALRDVIESIKVAYESGKILHRDISTGNVMISKEGRGILNDWDNALRLIPGEEFHASRTGTWQFISMALLQEPNKPHEVRDDLESCFWVLLYVSLHYFKHNGREVDFKLDFFDEIKERRMDKAPYQSVGGNLKIALLIADELDEVRWECHPLDELVHTLARLWRLAFALDGKLARILGKLAEKDILSSALEKVSLVLDMFDTALASEGWNDKDVIADQYSGKYQPNMDKGVAKRKTRSTASVVFQSQAVVAPTRRTATGVVPAHASPPPVAPWFGIMQCYQSNTYPTAEKMAFLRRLAMPRASGSKKRTIDDAQAEEQNMPVSSSKRIKTGDPPLSSGQRSTYVPAAPPHPASSSVRSPTQPSSFSAPTFPTAEANRSPHGSSRLDRLPSLGVHHRYLTRSKPKLNNVQASKNREDSLKEAPPEDVKAYEHRYPTRSKSNLKRPGPQHPPRLLNTQTQLNVKKNNRSTASDSKGT